jgi:uncharacterized membrane protein
VPGITCSTFVAAPVERVFALGTDIENWPQYIKGIKRVELLTEGPFRVGTRFRETRLMHGREATEEMEVTAVEPGRGYTLGCTSCGCQYRSEFRFQPEGGGTRVTMDFEARPLSLFARLMSPLAWLMKGMVRKCVEEDLRDLKSHAEAMQTAGG